MPAMPPMMPPTPDAAPPACKAPARSAPPEMDVPAALRLLAQNQPASDEQASLRPGPSSVLPLLWLLLTGLVMLAFASGFWAGRYTSWGPATHLDNSAHTPARAPDKRIESNGANVHWLTPGSAP